MRRYFLLLFALFFTVQFVSQNANADYCAQECAFKSPDCYATDDRGYIGTASRTWTCSINEKTIFGISYLGYTLGNDCSDSSTTCKQSGCPTASIPDGAACTVRVPCGSFNPLFLGNCNTKSLTGVWDASDNKCIVCTPGTAAIKNSEFEIIGQGSNPYVYVFNSGIYTLQNPGDACLTGTITAWQMGDAKFEPACGADTACDEKIEGAACTTSTGKPGNCNSYGVCAISACTKCTDGTDCGSCSSTNLGQRCMNVGGIGVLQSDVSCACSSYTTSGSCTGASCIWCDSSHTPPNTCVLDNTQCTAPVCTFKNNPSLDDASCPDDCTGGCTLNKNVCSSANNCVKASSSFCGAGNSCSGSTSCHLSSGDCGGSAGGCAWWASNFGEFGVCSSGCPPSYYNAQQVCCETSIDSECNGRPACTSYNPTKGETPCCTAGGYYTCTSQEICTSTGCKNFCTDPTSIKDGEPYCSKCNSCQDGILNCGELALDKGGPNCGANCTMTVLGTFTVSGYGADTGPQRCQAAGGTFNKRLSCSYGDLCIVLNKQNGWIPK